MIVRYLPGNFNFFKIACVKSRPLEIQEKSHEFPKFAFLINSHHPPENIADTMDYKEAEREMQTLNCKRTIFNLKIENYAIGF